LSDTEAHALLNNAASRAIRTRVRLPSWLTRCARKTSAPNPRRKHIQATSGTIGHRALFAEKHGEEIASLVPECGFALAGLKDAVPD